MGKRKPKPYTFEEPYKETRTVKDLTFTGKESDKWVKIHMDYEDWEVCLEQWKDMGKPSPGDKILFRISPTEIKP
jgi:hypothetical protein